MLGTEILAPAGSFESLKAAVNCGADAVYIGGKQFSARQNAANFDDEELMTFAMGNCIVMEDTNGNRKLLKKRYDAKIDAVAAMMDAFVAYKLNREAFD